MSGYIDPAISPTSYDENQVAIINRYELHVTDRDGQFCVEDPFVRGLMGVNFSRFIGGNLQSLLVDAVRVHQECERGLENGNGKKTAVLATVPAKPSPAAKGVKDTIPETDSKPKPSSKKKAKVLPAKTKKSPAPSAPSVSAKPAPSAPPVAVREKPPEAPPTELSDVELDNTGKRKGKSKREITKKEKKDNRYLRAVKVIVNDFSILKDQKSLAKKSGMSESMAGNCIVAWESYTAVLAEKGWLKFPN